MIKAVVISRKEDRARRARIESTMPKSVDWSFLDAVDGHQPARIEERYRAIYPKLFWGSSRLKPGAFGCFVSHVKAWESCIDTGSPLAIFEDDTVISESAAGVLAACESVSADVLFLNRRMANWYRFSRAVGAFRLVPSRAIRQRLATRAALRHGHAAICATVTAHPLQSIVSRIVADDMIPMNHDTPGGDCYLISPKGAEALLQLSARHGAVVGVDWFIVASAMLGKALPPGRRWQLPAQALSYVNETTPVDVKVSECWIADSLDREIGGSVIKHNVLVDIEEYRRRFRD